MVRQSSKQTGTGGNPRSILEAARLGRFRFSVLGLSRSLAVSRARIDARLTRPSQLDSNFGNFAAGRRG